MRLRVPLEHEANRPNKMAVALTAGKMMMMMENGKAITRR